jgi:putative membrane protein
MQPFTRKEQTAIEKAIKRAEANTSGEIVVVVTGSSDGYRSFAILWAALLALAVPIPLIWATKWPVEYIYLLQLSTFLFFGILFQWEPVRYALAPKCVMRARAHQKAIEQFLAQSLHTTKGRTGVLIFVSFAEHFAEVIADEGIYRKVSPEIWRELIEELTAHIGAGQRSKGLVKAVERCGKILAEHFPPGACDANELPNHLIVLDAYRDA